jgi:hypothetical protein
VSSVDVAWFALVTVAALALAAQRLGAERGRN